MTARFAMHAIHQQSIKRDGVDSGVDVTEYGKSAVGATRVELQCQVRNDAKLLRGPITVQTQKECSNFRHNIIFVYDVRSLPSSLQFTKASINH